METDIINETVMSLENGINAVKNAIRTIELEKDNQKRKEEFEKVRDSRLLRTANIMRTACSLFSTGLSSWEVAERIADNFNSVWDAYYFVSSYHAQELARERYARTFLIQKLKQSGFSNAKIATIAGVSPQYCGRITKSA